jgi:hypothetical protein
MKNKKSLFVGLLSLLCFFTSLSVQAHPGHDHFSEGVVHAISSGYHILWLSVLGVLLFLAGELLRRTVWGMRLQIAGVASLAGAVVSWLIYY